MTSALRARPLRFRSIFISDCHLGSRACRAELLLDFLVRTESQHLFLVGDIFDIWSLRRTFFWPPSHSDVLRALLGKARDGTRVVYVPGNHDDIFRELAGHVFGNIEIRREHQHLTADGRRMLILHGDELDGAIRYNRLLRIIGSQSYCLLLWVNSLLNLLSRRLGLPYWSLANHVKRQVKNALSYIARFELAVARVAARRRMDAVVCGHIHHAATRRVGRVLYCNDGDWVESCTALVELHDGRLELLRWADLVMERESVQSTAAAA